MIVHPHAQRPTPHARCGPSVRASKSTPHDLSAEQSDQSNQSVHRSHGLTWLCVAIMMAALLSVAMRRSLSTPSANAPTRVTVRAVRSFLAFVPFTHHASATRRPLGARRSETSKTRHATFRKAQRLCAGQVLGRCATACQGPDASGGWWPCRGRVPCRSHRGPTWHMGRGAWDVVAAELPTGRNQAKRPCWKVLEGVLAAWYVQEGDGVVVGGVCACLGCVEGVGLAKLGRA